MIPRGAPYIAWPDLMAASLNCLRPDDRDAAQRGVEEAWAPNTVALLSVRSGLDALLQVLALPPESEVVMSAITIPHFLDILAHHRLVAVPIDVDLATLAVDDVAVRAAITDRTRAILVAHLFGSRMALDGIAAIAAEHDLLLLEDCAQANDGTDYRGHPESTVSMFSFGSIKRQTALGGGLLRFKEPALATSVRNVQAGYPTLARTAYLRRVATMAFIKTVAARPLFDLFISVCRRLGRDHDATLGTALRGFAHGDLFVRLRQHPGAPLMRTLSRRLRQPSQRAIAERVAVVNTVVAAYPELDRTGQGAAHHTHWLFPMTTAMPDGLMHHLWEHGFDATRGASNLLCVPAPTGRPVPEQARQLMSEVLYLPLCPTSSAGEMQKMAAAIREYDAAHHA
ncbi:MAG: DegT/DnrJ/EryC1/StrS family aminotransferase [bacterium]